MLRIPVMMISSLDPIFFYLFVRISVNRDGEKDQDLAAEMTGCGKASQFLFYLLKGTCFIFKIISQMETSEDYWIK